MTRGESTGEYGSMERRGHRRRRKVSGRLSRNGDGEGHTGLALALEVATSMGDLAGGGGPITSARLSAPRVHIFHPLSPAVSVSRERIVRSSAVGQRRLCVNAWAGETAGTECPAHDQFELTAQPSKNPTPGSGVGR